jgi:ribonuclease HI
MIQLEKKCEVGAILTGYFDGASRGNPGIAGAGACLMDDGKIIWKHAEYLGVKTNNEAEYSALICLLEGIREKGISEIEIRGDSKLVINQVGGKWKIKFPHLRELAARAWRLLDGINARFVWVPREENVICDALSNEAIDGRKRRTEV